MLTDVQAQFQDSARRYLSTESWGSRSRPLRGVWRAIAELGWIGASVPEAQGGFGGDAEAVLLSREIGEALASLPYPASGVLPAVFLGGLGAASFGGVSLVQVIEGEVLVSASPLLEGLGESRLELEDANELRVRGRLDNLRDVGAEVLFVPAVRARDGRRVVVALDAEAVRAAGAIFATIDGGAVIKSDLVGTGLAPLEVCESEVGLAAYERATDAALLAQCAELVGGMSRMFQFTRDYLATRKQFGHRLADFQALRHRLADMFAELELAQAMLQAGLAAMRLTSSMERSRVVSACRLRVGNAVRQVSAQALQLHGAIALTEEYALGAYYRRALVLRKTWGDEAYHAARVNRLGRDSPPDGARGELGSA